MTTTNEVNDVNSPVQTQESEIGDAELQVETSRVDAGEKSNESTMRCFLQLRGMRKNVCD